MFFCRHINTENRICARQKVLIAAFLNIQVLWDVLVCSCVHVNISRCIEGSQRLRRWVYISLSSRAPSLLGLLVLDNGGTVILRNAGHYLPTSQSDIPEDLNLQRNLYFKAFGLK
jgi:hypothetical protein